MIRKWVFYSSTINQSINIATGFMKSQTIGDWSWVGDQAAGGRSCRGRQHFDSLHAKPNLYREYKNPQLLWQQVPFLCLFLLLQDKTADRLGSARLGWAGLGWVADQLASCSSTSYPTPSKVVLRSFVGVNAAYCVHPHVSSVTGCQRNPYELCWCDQCCVLRASPIQFCHSFILQHDTPKNPHERSTLLVSIMCPAQHPHSSLTGQHKKNHYQCFVLHGTCIVLSQDNAKKNHC